jgi:hypothetical protein
MSYDSEKNGKKPESPGRVIGGFFLYVLRNESEICS